MTDTTPSLAQVLAEMRAAAEHPLHGEPRWAAALARLEPLVAAAEACPAALQGPKWERALIRLRDEALALFAKRRDESGTVHPGFEICLR